MLADWAEVIAKTFSKGNNSLLLTSSSDRLHSASASLNQLWPLCLAMREQVDESWVPWLPYETEQPYYFSTTYIWILYEEEINCLMWAIIFWGLKLFLTLKKIKYLFLYKREIKILRSLPFMIFKMTSLFLQVLSLMTNIGSFKFNWKQIL